MTQCAEGCLGGLMSYLCRSSLYFVYLHSVNVHSFIEFCRFHIQLQGLFSAGVIYVPCIRNKFKQQGPIVLHHAFTLCRRTMLRETSWHLLGLRTVILS